MKSPPVLATRVAVVLGAAAALATMTGCESAAPRFELTPVMQAEGRLSKDKAVVIAVPADGAIRGGVYPGSGRECAAAFQRAFAASAGAQASVVECPSGSCERGGGYFVALQILNWEDRATAWSGNVDRLTIRVTVIDGPSNRTLGSQILQATGTMSARVSQDLLPGLATRFVQSLY